MVSEFQWRKLIFGLFEAIPFKTRSIFQKIEGDHSFGPFKIRHFLVVFSQKYPKILCKWVEVIGLPVLLMDFTDLMFALDCFYSNPFEFKSLYFTFNNVLLASSSGFIAIKDKLLILTLGELWEVVGWANSIEEVSLLLHQFTSSESVLNSQCLDGLDWRFSTNRTKVLFSLIMIWETLIY